MAATTAGSSDTGVTATLRRGLTAPFREQTYRNLLYLALAFPLGLAYFVGFVTGTALGVGLFITWVGLPILALTLAATTAVAGFEARLGATATAGLLSVDDS